MSSHARHRYFPPFVALLAVLALAAPVARGDAERALGADTAGDTHRWRDSEHRHHRWRHRQDHERARRALMLGQILPLAEILRRVRARVPGEVVGVELEEERRAERSVWIYEIRLLSAAGRRLEVEVDAADGRVLEVDD